MAAITYNGKNIVELTRTLVINPEKGFAILYLKTPHETDMPEGMKYSNELGFELTETGWRPPQKTQIIEPQGKRLISIPVKGKLNLDEIDEIYLWHMDEPLTPDEIKEIAKYVNMPTEEKKE